MEFTVCGRVVGFDCSRSGDTVLLDLDRPGQDRSVSIGVRSARRRALGERFEDPYLGAEVCGTGRVERADRRYVVVVDTPTSLVLQHPGPADAVLIAPSGTQSCGTGIETPVLTREVKPLYTPDAMRAKIQGVVHLEAVVLPNGSVGNVRVVKSLDSTFGLDEQGIAAAKRWRFKPGTWRGRAVPMAVTIELTFALR